MRGSGVRFPLLLQFELITINTIFVFTIVQMGKIRNNVRLTADVKAKIFALRKSGLSYGEIANELDIKGKNTIFYWANKMKLTKKQQSDLAKRSQSKRVVGFSIQSEKNKVEAQKLRDKYKAAGFERAKSDEHFRMICALYWAEGTKGKNSLAFVNSDIEMMRIVIDWVASNCLGKKINFSIRYYSQNGFSQKQIKDKWISMICLLGKYDIKMCKNKIKRISQRKGIGKLPYGVGHLQVHSTELVQNIFGGIDFIKQNI